MLDESDAKNLAGKEQREMEALFGKSATSAPKGNQNAPGVKTRGGTEFVNGPTGVLRKLPWE